MPAEAPTGVIEAGCYRQIEYAGIVAGTNVQSAAEELIDFMLDLEFQEDIPLNMFVFPVNRNAALPSVFIEFTSVPEDPAALPIRPPSTPTVTVGSKNGSRSSQGDSTAETLVEAHPGRLLRDLLCIPAQPDHRCQLHAGRKTRSLERKVVLRLGDALDREGAPDALHASASNVRTAPAACSGIQKLQKCVGGGQGMAMIIERLS